MIHVPPEADLFFRKALRDARGQRPATPAQPQVIVVPQQAYQQPATDRKLLKLVKSLAAKVESLIANNPRELSPPAISSPPATPEKQGESVANKTSVETPRLTFAFLRKAFDEAKHPRGDLQEAFEKAVINGLKYEKPTEEEIVEFVGEFLQELGDS